MSREVLSKKQYALVGEMDREDKVIVVDVYTTRPTNKHKDGKVTKCWLVHRKNYKDNRIVVSTTVKLHPVQVSQSNRIMKFLVKIENRTMGGGSYERTVYEVIDNWKLIYDEEESRNQVRYRGRKDSCEQVST